MGDERSPAAHHREELAWAAGLWDGEGSCGCYGKNDGRKRRASNTYVRASVSQNDREVLDRFCAAVGVGKVYGPYPSGPPYSWQLHGAEKVGEMFDKIWPWLSSIKRQQRLDVFAKYEARGDNSSKGGHVCAPDCTCGRQKWKTEDLDPAVARRREQQREATRRYRERKRKEDDDMREVSNLYEES